MKKGTSEKLYPVLAVFLLLFVWQAAVGWGFVDSFSIPSPLSIFAALIGEMGVLIGHLKITLLEGLVGILFATVFAVVVAVMMNMSPVIKSSVYPLLVFSQTVPVIVLAPLFAMWFGFGLLPKIVVVTLVCFFPITVSITEGLSEVDTELLNMMRTMGANKKQLFLKAQFPAVLVPFYSGLKIAVTYSIMGAIIGEWMGGTAGLGVYMMRVKNSFAYDKMFAAIVLISITSIVLFKGIEAVQRATTPWSYYDAEKEQE
jgi:ABC-type nitrate/sulfonate/bicarbonate transport system permease component